MLGLGLGIGLALGPEAQVLGLGLVTQGRGPGDGLVPCLLTSPAGKRIKTVAIETRLCGRLSLLPIVSGK